MTTSSDSPLVFNCPSCGGRIKTLRSQAGTKCKCPKCTAAVVVPAPEESLASSQFPGRDRLDSPATQPAIEQQIRPSDDADDEEDDFKLSDPVERLTLEPAVSAAHIDSLAGDEPWSELPKTSRPPMQPDPVDVAQGRTRLLDSQPERPMLPPIPQPVHVFQIMTELDVIVRGIGMSMALSLEMILVIKAIEFRSAGLLMVASMVFTMAAVVFGGLLAVAASTVFLAIVRDTSNGSQRVESWPQPAFAEWFIESLYIWTSCFLGLLPGLGVAVVLDVIGLPSWLSWCAAPVSLAAIFPITLLSMLEAGSFITPYSEIIWRSLREATRAWRLFYAGSAALMLVGLLALLAQIFGGYWLILPANLVLIALLLIYFRMLGLLAWYWANVSVVESADED